MMTDDNSRYFDAVIIGAGAAGLMCAFTAANRGRSVLVLDHANKAGKKILMSGGGRCNFTNYYIEPNRYLCHNPHFCKSALSRYSQWDFISLVEKHGIPYHDKGEGELFCDHKSSDILNMLLAECDQAGVVVQLNTDINAVTALIEEPGYHLNTSGGDFRCQSLVVASGGLSIPTLGATGFGYKIAEQFGLQTYSTRAGLVPFVITDQLKQVCTELSGSSCRVEISCNGQSFLTDMLFTHRGLSGPAVLQISSYWSEGDALQINLLPELDLADALRQAQHDKPKMSLKNFLSQWLTQKMADKLLEFWGYSGQLSQLNGADMDALAASFHRWQLVPSGTEGYRTAEVTLGGIDTDEVSSKTLEAKKQPGLYFIGEVLDVTGHLGGFNFQWAWSSGWAAAQVI